MNMNMLKNGKKNGKMKKDNIILIGMPGVGKSTVGVVLAKNMGYSFVDSDLLIQEQEGKLLHEIIEERGLEGFNEVENRVNASIGISRAVIATGGSVIYGRQAMEHLKQIGTVVYLSLPYEELSERLGDLNERGVSIREDQTLADLMRERTPLYEKYADVTIDCAGRQIREIVQMIKLTVQKHDRLEKNLVDLIKEEQAKLGYRREAVRLYYPLQSLRHFYDCSDDADEMQQRISDFPKAVAATLGAVEISHKGDRFCFVIPESGTEYVHTQMEENEFICRLVELIGSHGTTMEQIKALFETQCTPCIITEMDSDEFDVMIHFTEGDDPYYYCFKDEGCHVIYHRFLPEDYAEIVS